MENQPKHQNYDMLYAYLNTTTFFQQLRNKYPCITELSKQEQQSLVVSGEILRLNPEKYKTYLIEAIEEKIFLIIHGEVEYNDIKYYKGESFCSHDSPPKPKLTRKVSSISIKSNREIQPTVLHLNINSKTALLILSKNNLEANLNHLQSNFDKFNILTRILIHSREDRLNLNRKFMRFLSYKLKIHQCHHFGTMLIGTSNKKVNAFSNFKVELENISKNDQSFKPKQNENVYFLIEGQYLILDSNDVALSEVEKTYCGEQILWNDTYQFKLKLKSQYGKYGVISKDQFMEFPDENFIKYLKKIYGLRKQHRNNLISSIEAIKKPKQTEFKNTTATSSDILQLKIKHLSTVEKMKGNLAQSHTKLFNPKRHISSASTKLYRYESKNPQESQTKDKFLKTYKSSMFKLEQRRLFSQSKAKSLIKLNKVTFIDSNDCNLATNTSFYNLKKQFPKRPQLMNMKRLFKKIQEEGLYSKRLYTSSK